MLNEHKIGKYCMNYLFLLSFMSTLLRNYNLIKQHDILLNSRILHSLMKRFKSYSRP